MTENTFKMIDRRAIFFKIFNPTVKSELRIPAHFLRHISEDSPDKATLKCLSGDTWNVKLDIDENGLLIHQGWEKFHKDNHIEDGEFLVFRYDEALQFTVRIFSKNGMERVVKPINMDKNKKTSISDMGKNHKRPSKYPYSSKFTKQTHVDVENGTEHETPRKKVAVEKTEVPLTPDIPEFVKCLKGYNVNKSCFIYVPKSFCEQLSESANKTTVILSNSEGKKWKVNFILQKGYHALCGGWKQFVKDNKFKEGDVCVFQLVNTNELKVSVIDNPPESLVKIAA